ncbi:hypothetical protein CEK26_003442 [Fusarium fujikuroi]|nr:hypothetical protein CEK26_003442 [Fusarium fujikuroi]
MQSGSHDQMFQPVRGCHLSVVRGFMPTPLSVRSLLSTVIIDYSGSSGLAILADSTSPDFPSSSLPEALNHGKRFNRQPDIGGFGRGDCKSEKQLGEHNTRRPRFLFDGRFACTCASEALPFITTKWGLSALEESITFLRQVIDGSSINDTRRAEWLISLAFGLSLRCDVTDSESDAREASRLSFEALGAVEKDGPPYATILQSACHFIGKQAIRLHKEDDLEKVFEMHKSIISATTVDHPKLRSRLRSYDNTLFKGYLSFRHIECLEEAIRVSEYIVNIPDQSTEDHARNVWILSHRLVQRYVRTGTTADLDDSIRACQQAVDDTPINSNDRQRRLQSLCDRLGEKQTGHDDDFQRAIHVAREAINLTAKSDIGRAVRLSNLSGVYAEAYGKTGNTERLEEAIRIGRDTLAATPDGHPDKALRQRNGETIMDRIMSSYATSVSAIVQSRRTAPVSNNEALLVSAGETPGHRRLAFADREVNVLRDICRQMKLEPVEPEPIREDVLSHLRKCKIFHFAGHGYTDTADPSKSQLYLRDWQTEPLTVASLPELNLHRESPFLAYLSACGTGQIKSEKLFDEDIHLISACQLAGFRHVIGTLWEVNDQSCVDMAAIIYEEILRGDMSDESVCRGVHVATKQKRDQWLDETYGAEKGSRKQKGEAGVERDIISLEEDDGQGISGIGNGPLHWVPYVHFGA